MYNEKYLTPSIRIESIISCFETKIKAPYTFKGEYHPFWELVYVIDGDLNVAGDEHIYRLHTGDVIFHKPMEFHRLWSADTDIHAFIIAFRAEGPIMKMLECCALSVNSAQAASFDKLLCFLQHTFPYKKNLFHYAMFEKWDECQVEITVAVNLLENILLSCPNAKKANPLKTDSTYGSEIYTRIISELNANIGGQITLGELAEKCSFSVSQIKRVFAQYSDIGIHKYFLKMKTATAIQMLGNGMSVGETAAKLGFSDQNYFSAVFRRETGKSPTDYKKTLGV